MIVYYDLHIHTVLSSCADILMTPNNLWNMATLKGLDVVGFVDHNSAAQLPMLNQIGQSYQALQIVGVELNIQQGVHLLCYFEHLDDCLSFSKEIEQLLDKDWLLETKANPQVLTDEEDFPTDSIPYFLNQALPLRIEEVKQLLNPYPHLFVLAHINRYLEVAKDLVKQYAFDAVEWTKEEETIPFDPHCFVLYSSDAHELTSILEKGPRNWISLKEYSVKAFFEEVRRGSSC